MRKPIILTSTPTNSVKGMSIYRMSDAPPDWEQNDPSQPDYIANKELAEKFRPIYVNDELLLDSSYESGAITLIPGTNITISTQKNTNGQAIIISALGEGGGSSAVDYLGVVNDADELSTVAEKATHGDFVRVATAFDNYHIGDLLIYHKPEEAEAATWVVIHGEEGDIIEVEAGNGLTGGGSSGKVTLNIAEKGVDGLKKVLKTDEIPAKEEAPAEEKPEE